MMGQQNPALVIMAAGIGSRYAGGIKQLESVGPNGELIIDYSIYDAVQAGFRKIIFVIRHEIEQDFREIIGNRLEKKLDKLGISCCYAFQELSDLPEGFSVPSGRTKPWGTGQAVLSCKDMIQEPFAVINADDYYGKEAFRKICCFLKEKVQQFDHQFCMAGFVLKNTLSENGAVTRGICQMDQDGYLQSIHETQGIIKTADGIQADGRNFAPDAIVSMNMWGLTPLFLKMLQQGFLDFLKEHHADLKSEFLLPIFIDQLLREKRASVQVLLTQDQWFGVTYREDRDYVVKAFQELMMRGEYEDIFFNR